MIGVIEVIVHQRLRYDVDTKKPQNKIKENWLWWSCVVQLNFFGFCKGQNKYRAWEWTRYFPWVTGQEVCQTVHNLYIRESLFLPSSTPPRPIFCISHPPPLTPMSLKLLAFFFSNIHLILSHFLRSRLPNDLLHPFYDFILPPANTSSASIHLPLLCVSPADWNMNCVTNHILLLVY